MSNTATVLRHDFGLLLQGFGEYLAARNLSRRTVEEYPREVKPFLDFLASQGVENIRSATVKHIQAYHGHLMERTWRGKPLTSSTHNRRLGEVKAFFRFLHKTGRVYTDPSANVDLPRRSERLPRNILEIKEVVAILEQPDLSVPVGVRDRAILELFYSCGLRCDELRNLEVRDADLEGRILRVQHGKGDREALVPFGRHAQKALEHYLLFSRPRLIAGRRGGKAKSYRQLNEERGREYLFLSKNGYRLGNSNTYVMVRKYASKAGIKKMIGPHSFRHTCATHLLRQGADIRHIQQLLRHKDINTTQKYTKVAIEDLKEAQAKYHPRERAND